MFSNREYTQVKRPVAPPIDLDGGRLDVLRASLAGCFVLAALLLASLGGYLMAAVWSSSPLGVVVGGVLAVVGLVFGAVVMWVSVAEWLDHRARVSEWHYVAIEAYMESGAEVIEHVSEWALSADNPGHMLLLALWVHRRVAEGADSPWSVRSLQGPFIMSGQRVGELSHQSAVDVGRRLERLGLLEGRSERVAGEWSASSEADIIRRVWDEWH